MTFIRFLGIAPGMARKLRIEYPRAIYHVMNRGDRRRDIFHDDPDREPPPEKRRSKPETTNNPSTTEDLKKSGFISHDMDKDSMGEPTSPGDAAQLALWLATRHSYTEFFDDVERIVRARLIPCQITATPSLKQAELAPMLIGAYRGMYKKSHAGKVATTDITAAVTHTLVDVYRHIAVQNDITLKINLHFDYEDLHVCIASERTQSATVTIVPKHTVNVLIRIPRWTPKESVRLVVAGKSLPLYLVGDYAFVPRDLMPAEVTLTYDLPVSTEIERTDNVDYAITWRGNEIIGISPNSTFLPFYPDAFVDHAGK